MAYMECAEPNCDYTIGDPDPAKVAARMDFHMGDKHMNHSTAQITELLNEVYEPAGVHIWLTRVHKSGPLAGHRPADLIAAGRADEVRAAAASLSGQIAT